MEKDMIEREKEILFSLIKLEDLAEKKAMIHSRLLTEPALAQEMEALSKRHMERKNRLLSLVGEKVEKEGGDEA
jgi:hypothetical protein